MPQYYTLEEAAKVLQMPPDELREKAKKKEVRAFQDRGNWRFLSQQIDELARERGIGSDADLQLSDTDRRALKGGEDRVAVDFNLEDDAVPLGKDKDPRSTKSGPKSPGLKSSGPKSSGTGPRSPKPSSDSDVRLVMDSNLDFQIDSDVKVEPSGPKSSGTRSAGKKSKVVPDSGVKMVDKPSDSDVKVVPSESEGPGSGKGAKSPSDSDIRLDPSGSGKKKGPDAGIITEEIDLDAEEARLSAKSKSGAKPKPMTKAAPQLPTSSPFELSESDLTLDNPAAAKGPKSSGARAKPKKEVDSSSDFELIPFDETKAPGELGSGEIPLLSGDEEVGLADLPAPNAGNSGINLQDPADSGISLESGGSDELEFELSLDSGVTPKPAGKKAEAKKPAAKKPEAKAPAAKKPEAKKPAEAKDDKDSSSEFELSLEDPSSDDSSSEFELSLDESSETVGLKPTGESSDSEFELTLDDDGSLAADESDDDKDIFEETNFDVPALEEESGSEAVAIDESDTDLEGSDFEISLDESGTSERSDSQVVALEDEEDADDAAATVARPRKTKAKSKASVAAEDEEELDLEDIEGSGPRKKKATDEEEEDEDELVAAGSAAPAEWGPWPALLLFPTVLVMFVVGLMGFELVQGMWGYHKPAKVSKLITDTIARQIDESLPKD